MGVNQDFPKGTHRSIHLSCGDTMVFPDIFPERRTVRKQLELSGRNLRDSRFEHVLLRKVEIHSVFQSPTFGYHLNDYWMKASALLHKKQEFYFSFSSERAELYNS